MADIPEIEGYGDPVRIARGGFAVVYRAHQERFDRVVALKVLSVEEIDDRARRRFERECRVMGSLSWHPNVVAVLDSGVADGHPWLSMEFLDAGSLAARLERDGALPWSEVVDIGIQVAGALGAAHASGVLHRDLKPENLLIGPFGETKLADFGIAAVEGGTRTTTGSASFTVAHVAPEILEGRAPDERSDVYGLASTLHTLVTGQPPFAGEREESIATLITRILHAPAPRLTGVPAALADLIESALAKAPDDRPPTAEALGRGLQAVQAAEGLPTTALRLAPTSATPAGTTAVPEPERSPDAPDAATVPPDNSDATVARRRTDEAPPRPPEPPAEPGTDSAPGEGRGRRRKLALGAPAVVLVAVAVAVGVVVTRSGDDTAGGTPRVTATIEVGQSPRDVTITEDAVWVTTYDDDTVARIDPDTGEATATVLQDNGPQGITESAEAVWVGNYSDGTLSRIDPATGEPTATIELHGSPQDVSATEDGVWVAMLEDSALRVDIDTLAVGDPVPVAPGPQGVAATDDAVWVTSVVADELTRIDPDTGTVVTSIASGSGPWGVAATEEAVWVTNSGDGTVVRIDPATNQITATIDVGPDPLGIAVTDDAVWVAVAGENAVVRIDPESLTITDTLDVGAGPRGIAANDETVWVANEGDGTVTRIDLG